MKRPRKNIIHSMRLLEDSIEETAAAFQSMLGMTNNAKLIFLFPDVQSKS